jgi:hypothetical protein
MFFRTGRRRGAMELWLSDSAGMITVEPLKAVSTNWATNVWELALCAAKERRTTADPSTPQVHKAAPAALRITSPYFQIA